MRSIASGTPGLLDDIHDWLGVRDAPSPATEVAMFKKKGIPGDDDYVEIPDDEVDEYEDEDEDDELFEDEDELEDDEAFDEEEFEDDFDEESYDDDEDDEDFADFDEDEDEDER